MNKLSSSSQHEAVFTLTDLLIQSIREDEKLGGAQIAAKLKILRDASWTGDERSRKAATDVFLGLKDQPEKLELLLDGNAKLGHLNELAALQARENFFHEAEQSGKQRPGGVAGFLPDADAATAVKALGEPVFEVVMTTHSTNNTGLQSMKALRETGIALKNHVEGKGDEAALRAAVKKYAETPLLHDGDGKNLTVRDEIDTMLYFLENAYQDLPQAYKEYDDALTKRPGYNPIDLKLNVRLGSWGSAGDKDGNNNIYAEHTLEAIALHKQKILQAYEKDLEEITRPELQPWKDSIHKAREALDPLVNEIMKLREEAVETRKAGSEFDSKGEEFSKRFDALSQAVKEATKDLKADHFIQALEKAHQPGDSSEENQKILNLTRRARTFGFTFGKIEYRETAEEYTRVTGRLVKGYEKLKDDKKGKEAELAGLLTQEPQQLAESLKKKIAEITRNGAAKSYSDDVDPIAYHTLKRMELARDHPDILHDNVLAECEGAHHLLEAQFLQSAVTKDGARPALGVVPLFEKPDTLGKVKQIMTEAYENEAYQEHLRYIAKKRSLSGPVQQVQIAQSDTARRTSFAGGRGYIHQASNDLQAAQQETASLFDQPLTTQLYIGGSLSDPFRNGGRALSGTVRALGMTRFAKFTFQGMDAFQYFNHPLSLARMFVRNIVSPAEKLAQHNGNGSENGSAKTGNSKNSVADEVAIAALKKTGDDYRQYDFDAINKMGVVLDALDYGTESAIVSNGSRAAARGVAFKGKADVKMGNTLGRIPVGKVRTIPYSEVWQHNEIDPSWIGALHLRRHLKDCAIARLDAIAEKEKERKELTAEEKEFRDNFKGISERNDANAHIALFYNRSPAFRDAMDHLGYAVAMTNSERLDMLEQKMNPDRYKALDEKSKAGHAQDYVKHLKDTLREVAELAIDAHGGPETPEEQRRQGWQLAPRQSSAFSMLRQRVLESENLADVRGDLEYRFNYRRPLAALKEAMRETPANADLYMKQRRIIHNAIDSAVMGRGSLQLTDPAYRHTVKEPERHRQPTPVVAARANGFAQGGIATHLL